MKFLLLFLFSAVFFFSCTPAQQADVVRPQFPPGTNGKLLDKGIWSIEFSSGVKGGIITSSEDITEYTSKAPCERRSVVLGTVLNRALLCNAPNIITLKTLGVPQASTLDIIPLPISTFLVKFNLQPNWDYSPPIFWESR